MVRLILTHLTVIATDSLLLALIGLVLFLALTGARAAEVAPAPRAADCACPEGDLRCRARAAIALQAAKARAIAVPEVMPDRHRAAARAALTHELRKQQAAVPVIPPATPR